MSNDEPFQRFDARTVNIAKLTTPVDCEVLAKECDFAIQMIDEQLQIPGFGDAGWRESALVARREFDHKRGLANLKRSALLEKAKTTISPEDSFKSRFMRAAQDTLPNDVYAVLFEMARLKDAA